MTWAELFFLVTGVFWWVLKLMQAVEWLDKTE